MSNNSHQHSIITSTLGHKWLPTTYHLMAMITVSCYQPFISQITGSTASKPATKLGTVFEAHLLLYDDNQVKVYLRSGHKWHIGRWSRIFEVLAESGDNLVRDGSCVLQMHVHLYKIRKRFGSIDSLFPLPVGLALTYQGRQCLCVQWDSVCHYAKSNQINLFQKQQARK